MRKIIFVGISFLLIALFLLRFFPFVQVRENSMSPTLKSESLLVLNRLSYIFYDVGMGDVLVFFSDKEEQIIKRCVLVQRAPLYWQGKYLYIPYLGISIEVNETVRRKLVIFDSVPDGFIFVLGDNLSQSIDSRNYGLVSLAQVQGKILWL